MVKRIFCFLCALIVFIFNCCPVYALDSFTLENFINVEANSFQYAIEPINNLLNDDYEYIYYFMYNRNGWNNQTVVGSHLPLEITVSNDTKEAYIKNNNSDSLYFSFGSDSILLNSGSTYTVEAWGNSHFPFDPVLLIYNKDCVNSDYCSADVYVEMKDPDDYEENGVVISGLKGFFSNMISGLGDVKDAIVNLPETIFNGLKDLFVPDVDAMKAKFDESLSEIRNELGFGPLIDTIDAMLNIDEGSVSPANFKKDFSFKLNGSDVNMSLILPFSAYFEGDARSDMVNYMKGLFYIMLIFYNLSEIYFMIRGVRPWKDPAISMTLNQIQRDDVDSYLGHINGDDQRVGIPWGRFRR